MQQAYAHHEDARDKKAAEDYARKRKEEAEARRRVKEQIEADKVERHARKLAEIASRQQQQQLTEGESHKACVDKQNSSLRFVGSFGIKPKKKRGGVVIIGGPSH